MSLQLGHVAVNFNKGRLKKEFELSSDYVRVTPSTGNFAGFPQVKDTAAYILRELAGEAGIKTVLIDVVFSKVHKPLLGNIGL